MEDDKINVKSKVNIILRRGIFFVYSNIYLKNYRMFWSDPIYIINLIHSLYFDRNVQFAHRFP